jgi:hypothetical protein
MIFKREFGPARGNVTGGYRTRVSRYVHFRFVKLIELMIMIMRRVNP